MTLDPLDVIAAREKGNMPEIAKTAFDRLERAIPPKGRRFYGYWDPDEKAYLACVVAAAGDDAERLALERIVIPGGRYRRARLRGAPQDIYPRIGATFEEMGKVIDDVDHARPWLEFYRAEDEIDLLVPVR